MRGGISETELQVLQRPAAPVLVDRVGEGLAVSSRAVEIHADHAIARRREQARVPAIGPAVAERALRAAVDKQNDRKRAVHDRLQLPAPNAVVVGTGEAELLESDGVELRE